jgi:hypothetical protein
MFCKEKSVNSVTAKLAKMVEELNEVAAQQAQAKANAEARITAARADADAAYLEGCRAVTVANKIEQLLS